MMRNLCILPHLEAHPRITVLDPVACMLHDGRVAMGVDSALRSGILASLDDLLASLELRPLGGDRFAVPAETTLMFDRIYGGSLLAQALVGAAATVEGKGPQSLHANFLRPGEPGRPLEVVVDRIRDGRSMVTRQVSVLQEDARLLIGVVSFHDNSGEPDVTGPPPEVSPPAEVPLLQTWANELPPELRARGRHWIERPPALEMRIPEAPAFLGGGHAGAARSHWMRLPRPVGSDDVLHAALLAYASDFFLMDMIFRAHPLELGPRNANGFSCDHAIWFHRPVRFDRWHLHTQEAVALVGERGLASGAIHDLEGHLAASVMQEVVVRPRPPR